MSALSKDVRKDAFVTDTMVMLTKFGDYLSTVESSLESMKLSGLNSIMTTFGQSGRLRSRGAKKLFTAHSKRFERDMSRLCRYSALTTLYSLLEVRARAFMADLKQDRPGKADFKDYSKKLSHFGFVHNFRSWLETAPFPVHISQPRVWGQLQDFQLIRNCIVHCHGDRSLVAKPQALNEAIKRTRKITFDSNGVLVVEREFVFEVCGRIQIFFQLLFQSSDYHLVLPPGYMDTFTENFKGFAADMEKKRAEYYARNTINLGGSL